MGNCGRALRARRPRCHRLTPVRKLPFLAVLGASALVLAGCTGTATVPFGAGCDSLVGTNPDVTELITVSGTVGTAPTVSMYSPLVVDETVHAVLTPGTGRVLESANQLTQLDMALYSGTTGERLVTTAFGDDNVSAPLALSTWGETFLGLEAGLMCATEGSRVIVAMSSDEVAFGQGMTGLGIAPGDSVIAVVDVRTVFPSKADGTDQFVAGHGLPTVVRAANGQPGIIIPGGAAPTELVVETLKRGDGDVVKAGDSVFLQYTGVTWDENRVFDSSWGGPARQLSLDQVVPGFAEAVTGQTVGSQVLAVIPAELGYGDQASGAIPAGATLVFVIDVLGIG